MAYKEFLLDGTPITIYKRKSSRSLRLSVDASGKVKVSIPYWVPYASGLQFAKSRQAWIDQHSHTPIVLSAGQAIGKNHHLEFVAASVNKPSSRIRLNQIIVKYPVQSSAEDSSVQSVAEAACVRALRQQSNKLLPIRLKELAGQHNFEYSQVAIKQMKSRWGSCDQHRNIVLNLFLIQLPWECIDYVLLHELIHTQVLRHGPDFWQAFEAVLPSAKARQKQLRGYQPKLLTA